MSRAPGPSRKPVAPRSLADLCRTIESKIAPLLENQTEAEPAEPGLDKVSRLADDILRYEKAKVLKDKMKFLSAIKTTLRALHCDDLHLMADIGPLLTALLAMLWKEGKDGRGSELHQMAATCSTSLLSYLAVCIEAGGGDAGARESCKSNMSFVVGLVLLANSIIEGGSDLQRRQAYDIAEASMTLSFDINGELVKACKSPWESVLSMTAMAKYLTTTGYGDSALTVFGILGHLAPHSENKNLMTDFFREDIFSSTVAEACRGIVKSKSIATLLKTWSDTVNDLMIEMYLKDWRVNKKIVVLPIKFTFINKTQVQKLRCRLAMFGENDVRYNGTGDGEMMQLLYRHIKDMKFAPDAVAIKYDLQDGDGPGLVQFRLLEPISKVIEARIQALIPKTSMPITASANFSLPAKAVATEHVAEKLPDKPEVPAAPVNNEDSDLTESDEQPEPETKAEKSAAAKTKATPAAAPARQLRSDKETHKTQAPTTITKTLLEAKKARAPEAPGASVGRETRDASTKDAVANKARRTEDIVDAAQKTLQNKQAREGSMDPPVVVMKPARPIGGTARTGSTAQDGADRPVARSHAAATEMDMHNEPIPGAQIEPARRIDTAASSPSVLTIKQDRLQPSKEAMRADNPRQDPTALVPAEQGRRTEHLRSAVAAPGHAVVSDMTGLAGIGDRPKVFPRQRKDIPHSIAGEGGRAGDKRFTPASLTGQSDPTPDSLQTVFEKSSGHVARETMDGSVPRPKHAGIQRPLTTKAGTFANQLQDVQPTGEDQAPSRRSDEREAQPYRKEHAAQPRPKMSVGAPWYPQNGEKSMSGSHGAVQLQTRTKGIEGRSDHPRQGVPSGSKQHIVAGSKMKSIAGYKRGRESSESNAEGPPPQRRKISLRRAVAIPKVASRSLGNDFDNEQFDAEFEAEDPDDVVPQRKPAAGVAHARTVPTDPLREALDGVLELLCERVRSHLDVIPAKTTESQKAICSMTDKVFQNANRRITALVDGSGRRANEDSVRKTTMFMQKRRQPFGLGIARVIREGSDRVEWPEDLFA